MRLSKYLSTFVVFMLLCIYANSQNKLSNRSQLFIESLTDQTDPASQKMRLKSIGASSDNAIPATIILKDAQTDITDQLETLGATNIVKIGRALTASIPLMAFDDVCAIESVVSVEIAKEIKPRMKKARELTNATKVNEGLENLPQAYKGKDVVIGVVDTGIDYTHPNFKDSEGNCRIKRVYDPSKLGSVTIGDLTLPGKEYATDEDIAKLSCDSKSESHGSHTSGIAGGSYSENQMQGMAPEADLVLCGLSNLSTTNIINAVKYIFAYAKSVGKPAVVNLSLGYHAGPHDGTSSDCVSYDELAEDGVIVMSSGNEGEDQLYLHKVFTNTTEPQLKTLIYSKVDEDDYTVYQDGYYALGFDAWSRNSNRFGIQFFVYDLTTNQVVATSDKFYPTTNQKSSFSWSSTTNTEFAKYFKGDIRAGAGLQSNNKYNISFTLKATPKKSESYMIGVQFFGEEGTEIDCWNEDSSCDFVSKKLEGYTDGNAEFSVSDMATGYKTLSIGAYCSNPNFPLLGKPGQYSYPGTPPQGQICDFSSYGTDANGRNHPDVTAPGMFVISSVNSNDTLPIFGHYPREFCSYEKKDNNRNYYWAHMMGTSMSSPAAAGIIALWLQANNKLKVDDIRKILETTSIKDDFVTKGNAVQWGHGKIDALAGIKQILNTTGINDVTASDNAMFVYPNPSDGQFAVYVQNCDKAVSLEIYAMNGSLAYSKEVTPDSQGVINVDVTGRLTSGIYLVKIAGQNTSHTSRLVIK